MGNSTIENNVAVIGSGGGIWNGQSLAIAGSTVTQNQAVIAGGGIFNQGTFASAGNTITDNIPDNVFPTS